MTAWPARDELRHVAVAQGLVGLSMLVASLVLGAEPKWLGLAALALLLLTLLLERWSRRGFTDTPPPPGAVTATRRRILLQRVPIALADDLLMVLVGVFLAVVDDPLFLGVFGLTFLLRSATRVVQAARVARWERDHGGRVLRTGGFLEEDRYYLAV